MRVLFTVSDWQGHYYPLVPLGWALQAAGHELRVVCAPSQTDTLCRTGLTPVPLVEPLLEMAVQSRLRNYWDAQQGSWPYPDLPPHPLTGEPMGSLDEFDFATFRAAERPRILQATRDGFDATVAFARDWRPDLVVHDRMSIEGLLAARVLGVPAVLHLWGPHGTAEPEPELRVIPGDPTGSFPRHGVPAMGPELIEYVIDPCPPSLESPSDAHRFRMRNVPYNGPGADPGMAPPTPGRPRVCVVWGHSMTRMYGPNSLLLPELVDAFKDFDAELVLLAGPADADALGEPPPGVTVLRDVPLRTVLPGSAAVVHCGGSGCTMTAVASGVPQLGIPFSAEMTLNVSRVAAAGAGIVVPASRADRAAAVRAALTEILATPAYHRSAARLREELLACPTPADLVPVLETLAWESLTTAA